MKWFSLIKLSDSKQHSVVLFINREGPRNIKNHIQLADTNITKKNVEVTTSAGHLILNMKTFTIVILLAGLLMAGHAQQASEEEDAPVRPTVVRDRNAVESASPEAIAKMIADFRRAVAEMGLTIADLIADLNL